MSFGTGILALLGGMRQGERDAAERRRREELQHRAEERETLSLLARLSQIPGIQIGDGGAIAAGRRPSSVIDVARSAIGARGGEKSPGITHGAGQTLPPGISIPGAPAAPGISRTPLINLPANPVGLRSPTIEAARAALSGAPGTPEAPAAPQPPGSRQPGTIVDLATITLGGAPHTITFDPSATPAARARAEKAERDAANRAAYARLEAEDPGSQGDYDPHFDYLEEERKQRATKQLEEALVNQGYSPSEAQLLAQYNMDLSSKRERAQELAMRRQEAAQRERAFQQQQAESRVQDLAEEAAGYLASGMKPELLGETLKVMHPEASVSEITRAVGMARSQAELQAATVAQATRSTSGGSRGSLLDAYGYDIAAPADAGAAGGAAAGDSVSARVADLEQQRADYDAAAAELRRRGIDPVEVIGRRP